MGELAVVENENVGVLMRRSTDVAGVCHDIVMKTAQSIQGKKYVRVEGWQSVAAAYGCIASARDVEVVAGGVRAIGELRRVSDGAILATAEGFVGTDEKTWEARPMYARRAMAQTRAVSRVCRSAFAFVVVLIDAGLSTTPAEEMDLVDSTAVIAAPPQGAAGLKQRLLTVTAPAKAAPEEPPPPTDADAPPPDEIEAPASTTRQHLPVTFRFGGSKGKTSFEVTDKDLNYYIQKASEAVADPEKARFLQANTHELGLLLAEARLRSGR